MIDPMLATGGSAVAAVARLKEAGARDIRIVCIVAAPEGVEPGRTRVPRRPHLHPGRRRRAERAEVHRAGPRGLRRPTLRHSLTHGPVTGGHGGTDATDPGRTAAWIHARRRHYGKPARRSHAEEQGHRGPRPERSTRRLRGGARRSPGSNRTRSRSEATPSTNSWAGCRSREAHLPDPPRRAADAVDRQAVRGRAGLVYRSRCHAAVHAGRTERRDDGRPHSRVSGGRRARVRRLSRRRHRVVHAVSAERAARRSARAAPYRDVARGDGRAGASSQGRIPTGFGHRIHTFDPRAARLLQLAQELELDGEHVRMIRAIERVLHARPGCRRAADPAQRRRCDRGGVRRPGFRPAAWRIRCSSSRACPGSSRTRTRSASGTSRCGRSTRRTTCTTARRPAACRRRGSRATVPLVRLPLLLPLPPGGCGTLRASSGGRLAQR